MVKICLFKFTFVFIHQFHNKILTSALLTYGAISWHSLIDHVLLQNCKPKISNYQLQLNCKLRKTWSSFYWLTPLVSISMCSSSLSLSAAASHFCFPQTGNPTWCHPTASSNCVSRFLKWFSGYWSYHSLCVISNQSRPQSKWMGREPQPH